MFLGSFPVLGQNYQPLKSNSLQVFYQFSEFSNTETYNMWGTQIDSAIAISPVDTIYYNYTIYRDTVLDTWSGEGCAWPNAPNWNGHHTRISNDGIAWFFNELGDSIEIHFDAGINESWLSYQYPNGDSIIAQVNSVDWVEDEWIGDSVKTFGFTRMLNGQVFNDPINSVELELYKNAGFRKTMDFVKFPNDTVEIIRVDPNTININSIGYKVGNQRRPFPSIGDGYYHVGSCSRSPCIVANHKSRQIIDVQPSGLNGDLLVTSIENTQTYTLGVLSQSGWDSYSCSYAPPSWSAVENTTITEPYEVSQGEFIPLIMDNNSHSLMPRKNRAAYMYIPNGSLTQPETCPYPLVSLPPIWLFDSEFQTDSCTERNWWMTIGGVSGSQSVFAPYIGFVSSNSWDIDSYSQLQRECQSGYRYLRISDLVCGESSMVGIEAQTAGPFINVFPNPANTQFTIEFLQARNTKLSIVDALGKSVYSLDVGSLSTVNLDCNEWSSGFYFISLETEENIVVHKLLIY